MTKQEFEHKIDKYGIPMNEIYASVGKQVLTPFTLGIFQEGSEWVVYEVGERNDYHERIRGNENESFDYFFTNLLVRLRLENYVTKYISKQLICTPKETIFSFLRSKYNMNEQVLQQAWDYLKQDFHVLNEVKYYAVNGEFVPEKYAYKVQGYSAQQLFETTYLDVLGGFNYLIYLKRKPKEALADLKAGLPRK